MKVLSTIMFVVFLAKSSLAGTNATLVLRGYVPPAINTLVTQTQLSSKVSLITFSSHINAKYMREAQKFEVEGLEQSGLEAKLTAVAGNDRTIQYELLVSHLQETMPVHKPIFLKISAN
jgi:hypothetical protein